MRYEMLGNYELGEVSESRERKHMQKPVLHEA
jgi:hypothetical protein